MGPSFSFLLRAGLLVAVAFVNAAPSPEGLEADLTLLIENDLEGANSPTADSAVILLGGQPKTLEEAELGCSALGEDLWSPELNTSSIQRSLDYLVYQGLAQNSTRFWIGRNESDGPRTIDAAGRVSSTSESQQLSALCAQTAPFSTNSTADTREKWRVTVTSNNEELTGFRDRFSFRFLGIRYAPQPTRFAYSVPHNGTGSAVSALRYRSQCYQLVDERVVGSEDCLFLNIWTPYLPRPGNVTDETKRRLKPVMFWIHGGAFTGGTGNDPTFDGGSVASRGDVVLVTFNYRVGSLGFLALRDGVTSGNFGLADQVNALDWVVANIRDFGGDPERITIFGQSAGAASVRAMMASPRALGKFVAAIPMSNLGGLNYGTTYSKYFTIDQQFNVAAANILNQTNCASAASQLTCLRAVSAVRFLSIDPARYLVVDGNYLTTDELELSSGPLLPFHLMMGTTREDATPFIRYPQPGVNESAYLSSIGFAPPPPDLFPTPTSTANETLNLFNVSSRLATDGEFRCIDQATVAAGLRNRRLGSGGGVYYYEFDRTYQTIDYPKLDVCEAPRTADHPAGDPSLPYLRCHSGELYYVFGNLARQGRPARDEFDFPFQRLIVDSFTSFARSFDPNPDPALLVARGYRSTLDEIQASGRWLPATVANLTQRVLEWPTRQGPFRELPQCDSLGLGLDYYG